MMLGKNRAKSGFITSNDAHVMAMLISRLDQTSVYVPDSGEYKHKLQSIGIRLLTSDSALVRKVMD